MGADCDFPNSCDCGCCATPEEVADALRYEIRRLAVERAVRAESLKSVFYAADDFLVAIDRERNCRVGCIHMFEVLRTGDVLLRRIKEMRAKLHD